MASTSPRRGEIWLAALGAGRRGELEKNCPVVVVSADELATEGADELVVIVPFSSSVTPSLLRPTIDPGSGIDNRSVAVCRAVRGVARSRLLRRLGAVDEETMDEIERAMALVLATA